MTNKDQRSYHAYLLRIWSDPSTSSGCDSNGEWRIELQSAETMEKTTLPTIGDLLPFIQAQVAADQTKMTCNVRSQKDAAP